MVAGIGSLLEPLSTFVDCFVRPYLQSLPSYIRDSIDSVKISEIKKVSENCVLVNLDVESLHKYSPPGRYHH